MNKCLRVFLLLSSASVCYSQATPQPSLSVEITKVNCLRSRISFHWKLKNEAQARVFVYSSFLQGPAEEYSSQQSGRLLMVQTTRLSRATFSVNEYRKAEFIRVDPGKVVEGKFADKRARWKKLADVKELKFVVGFGYKITDLMQELNDKEFLHPANPIVDWQVLSESQGVSLANCASR